MELKCRYAKIIIPNDLDYIDIAGNFTKSIAEKLGLGEKDSNDIQQSTEHAVSWMIHYSLADNERLSVEVSCEVVPLGFKVTIKDQGMPFDPSLLKKENSKKTTNTLPIEASVDEIIFNNLGSDGKEIVLLKYSHQNRIAKHYNACELERYQSPPETARSKKLNYIVKSMQPDEAIEVSKCIYKGYGYTYPYEHMYYPEKLAEMNQKNNIFSAVAISEEGDVMGHCALMYENTDDQIAEMGLGVVKPEYRTMGCFGKMTEFLIEKAITDKLAGLFVQAVTLHKYSQQTAARYSLKECALLLAYIPTTVDFRRVNKDLYQRITVFLCFRPLKNRSSAIIYPPKKHSAMIKNIYNNLEMTPVMVPPLSAKKPVFRSTSMIRIKVVKSLNFARIVCENYGSNIIREIRQRIRELCLKKIDVINLYMNLSDPYTGFVSEEIEQSGIIFAGILPGAMPNGCDALVYQYLNNIDIKYENIKAHSNIAKKLVSYVSGQDPNIPLR